MENMFARKFKNILGELFEILGKIFSQILSDNIKIKIAKQKYHSLSNELLLTIIFKFFNGLLSNYHNDLIVYREYKMSRGNSYKLKLNLNSYVNRRRFYLNNRGKLPLLMKKLLNEQSIYIDVGANIGETSLIASCYAKKVIAFEPITIESFKQNILQNPNKKNIRLYPFALSSKNSFDTIFISRTNDGGHSLNKKFMDSINTKIISSKKIKTRIFDDLNLGRVDFIKIDVEGHELEVLKGMKKTLKNVKYIYCETSKREYHTVFEFLNKFGFVPTTKNVDNLGVTNILFYKKENNIS